MKLDIQNRLIVLAKGEDKAHFMQENNLSRMVLNMSDPDENGEMDIWIDETIGMWETDKTIFRMELSNRDAKVINLHIASGGGFVDDALAIFNMLRDHPADVNAFIQGTVASAATVIAMAADKVYASNISQWLIHNPYMWGGGDYRAFQSAMDTARTYRDTIAKTYKRTGKPIEDVYKLMDEDRIMSAKEAQSWGFFDGLFEPSANKTKKKRMKNILGADPMNALSDTPPDPTSEVNNEAEIQMLELQLALQNAKLRV